jgi:hypothetical protein
MSILQACYDDDFEHSDEDVEEGEIKQEEEEGGEQEEQEGGEEEEEEEQEEQEEEEEGEQNNKKHSGGKLLITHEELRDLVAKKVREEMRKSRRPRRSTANRVVPYKNPRKPPRQRFEESPNVSFYEVFCRRFWCRCSQHACGRAVHSNFDISEQQLINYVFTNNGHRINFNNTWASRTRTLLRMCVPEARKEFLYFLMNYQLNQ